MDARKRPESKELIGFLGPDGEKPRDWRWLVRSATEPTVWLLRSSHDPAVLRLQATHLVHALTDGPFLRVRPLFVAGYKPPKLLRLKRPLASVRPDESTAPKRRANAPPDLFPSDDPTEFPYPLGSMLQDDVIEAYLKIRYASSDVFPTIVSTLYKEGTVRMEEERRSLAETKPRFVVAHQLLHYILCILDFPNRTVYVIDSHRISPDISGCNRAAVKRLVEVLPLISTHLRLVDARKYRITNGARIVALRSGPISVSHD